MELELTVTAVIQLFLDRDPYAPLPKLSIPLLWRQTDQNAIWQSGSSPVLYLLLHPINTSLIKCIVPKLGNSEPRNPSATLRIVMQNAAQICKQKHRGGIDGGTSAPFVFKKYLELCWEGAWRVTEHLITF